MYLPPHFAESRIEVLHDLVRAHPLAALVTLSSEGLVANHIPLHLSGEPAPFGTLRGHVSRANPVWSDLAPDLEVLAIFQGPESYITPSWLPTKAETGRVVPTWNYAVVHAHGRLRVVEDAAWLRSSLEALTDRAEAALPAPWRVDDAPADHIAQLMQGIVGIEIVITRLQGKWKTSQNQSPGNRAGIAQGLRAGGGEALRMAELVERNPSS